MADNTNIEEKAKNELKAKPTSLIGQIIAAVWIAFWSAFKFIKAEDGIEVNDILLSGLSIVACFSPVYVSIMLDKIKEIKLK